MKRTLALPSLAAALMIALTAAVAVSLTAGVPKASAYYLANGCDEFDPAQRDDVPLHAGSDDVLHA